MLDDLLSVPPKVTPTVVIPMANDPDIIGAIGEAIRRKLARFILIGDETAVRALADKFQEDITGSEFIQEADELLLNFTAHFHSTSTSLSQEASTL